MPKSDAIRTEDKDLPLRDDIRLLDRILGDTVREQSGEAVFDTVEHIRQNSVSFRATRMLQRAASSKRR
jgi:phosphoenolpyruvate carboxylase